MNPTQKLEILELLFNSMPFNYIFWKNKEGVYMGANTNQIALFDHNGQGFIGKTIYEIITDYEAARKIDEIDRKVMQDGTSLTLEDLVTTAQGEQRVFLTQKQPIRNRSGEIVGLLGFSVDITERKKMEDDLRRSKEMAEEANKAKTEFLENMRHDIRTPLTGIVGFADLLKMDSNTPHIHEYADNLIASSHALLELMDEVLEAIRVSSGEIPKLKKKFDLRHSLEHVIKLNRARAAQKSLSLSLDFDKSIPRYVIGDKVRIHRIVLELVANALNFTDTGFVKLTALLAKRQGQQLVIKLAIEDSGIGIPKDKQQEIYVQFKRLTPSYQGIYKGAGLGLSVVKQFVDELNGEIYVTSEPRIGSCFTCIIPLQEPLLDDDLGIEEYSSTAEDELYETTYAQQIKPPGPFVQSLEHRVLVVEDNIIAQHAAKSLLTKLQCTVDIAENGIKALELWKTQHYDLILMDIGLPDIDGYEVTHAIRVHELTKKTHTPIIALTAHAGDENKKRCIDAGMNAVLTKPLTAKNCSDIVIAFIPGRHAPENGPENSYRSDLPQIESHLFKLNAFPLLDIEEGLKTNGTESQLADMLSFMVKDSLPQDFLLMKEAHNQGNWEKTQQLAHKIKGGAVYVGALRIKMACQYLERYWKSGQRKLLEPLYQQAAAVITESIRAINDWLEERR
ncbi:response regulator [Legionella sp. 16cNR16C]|uniref:response regulator n=1 Tax=Legionella sp. 16cNR16C TaxID=2905656 RepID=UPI001E441838|nr:response regulator [Legionella sp. 16cNR16C]MCE3043554.1 response regulator [Legionella sp. 16cNR16C]